MVRRFFINNAIPILMSMMILTIFAGSIRSLTLFGVEEFVKINLGDFAVALGTILLAFFTALLVRSEIEEGKIERRRLAVHEQLSEFYSPFRAKIGIIFDNTIYIEILEEFRRSIDEIKLEYNYEYLASEQLKEKLREYFIIFRYDTERFRQLRVEKGTQDLVEEYVLQKLKDIKDTVIADYDSLIKEYNDLSRA